MTRFDALPARLFLLLAPLLLPALLPAQNAPSLTAELANPRITVGDVGAFVLKAVGGEPENIPKTIDVPGLNISYTASHFVQEMNNVNGRMSMKLVYTYHYTIEGSVPGEYVIPEISTSIKGTIVKSSPVKVRIVPSGASTINPAGPRFATLTLPQSDIYVNQIIPVSVEVYVQGHNSIRDVTAADLKHESFVIKRFQKVDRGVVDLRGGIYSRAELPTTIFALKPGRHQLGPASINVIIFENSTRFSVPSFFTPTRPRTIKSDLVDVEILPLPGGAPASFSGGVGDFRIEARATPTSVKVGDPISLEFNVRGTGNFETMSEPVIPNLDSSVWKTYEAKKDLQKESDGINEGHCVFTQVLIPLQVVDEIPAFELAYFDPSKPDYVTRRTPATPLTVTPDTTPALPTPGLSSQGAAPGGFSAALPSSPVAQYPDILHIRKSRPKWQTYSATGRPPVFVWVTNLALGGLFLGLLGIGIYRKVNLYRAKRNTEPKPETFRRAFQKLRPGLPRDDFFHHALEAFTLWEKENPDAPRDVLDVVSDYRKKCETALYSESSGDDSEPVSGSEANTFLKVLRRLAG